jgi:hypothetical protein
VRVTEEREKSQARRGTEKRQRGRLVAVRCTPEEAASLEARADAAGLSVGAYLRAAALGTTGVRAVRRPSVEKAALGRALGLLGRYGGNLNQLAHAANAAGAMPTTAELEALRREVREVKAALLQALGRGAAHGD